MAKRFASARVVVSACALAGVLAGADGGGVACAQVPAPVVDAANSRPLLAPSYQPFRMDFGFGAADLLDQQAYGGSVTVEPKINILDQVAVGARIDATIAGGGKIGAPGSGEVTVKQNVDVATLLKGDFFLTRTKVRPWVGLGAGAYTIVGQGTSTSSTGATVNQRAGRYFGVAPQVGLELGGFRLSATYNKILGAQVEVTQNVGGTNQTKKYSQDYVSVELGFRFGGRRLLQSL